jgi:hypothetical protein
MLGRAYSTNVRVETQVTLCATLSILEQIRHGLKLSWAFRLATKPIY